LINGYNRTADDSKKKQKFEDEKLPIKAKGTIWIVWQVEITFQFARQCLGYE
jgi:hypothetical protein